MSSSSPILCLAKLELPLQAALHIAMRRGFTQIVLSATTDRPLEDREILAESGLLVAGTWLGAGLTADCWLDVFSIDQRRIAVETLKHQVSDTARLGGTFAILPPGSDSSKPALDRFGEGAALLAEYAQQRMVRVCVGHAAGSALATATQCLALLQEIPAAYLHLHADACMQAGDDPLAVAQQAGQRLGCVLLGTPTQGLVDRLRALDYEGPTVIRPP